MPSSNSSLLKFLARVPAFRAKAEPQRAPGLASGFAWSIGIVVVATVLRLLLDPYLPPGFPYLTYFPAIVLTGFFVGMAPAVLSSVLCGICAWYWFIAPVQSFVLNYQSVVALGFFAVVVFIDLGILQLALLAYRERSRAGAELQRVLEVQETVSREVDHRMKNIFATVNGLISMSRRHAQTPEDLARMLQSRIVAMSEGVGVLRGHLHGQAADVRSTLRSGLMPLGLIEGERLTLQGPMLRLESSAIVTLNLIFHELGTNALKYGALSTESGRIDVSWKEGEEEGRPVVNFIWREQGGPSVAVPARKGFGSDLVTRMAAGMGGGCDFAFEPDGLVFQLTAERDALVARA